MSRKISIACIFLASGFSTRFGSNKLLTPFGKETMAQHIINNHAAELFLCNIVVTRYPLVALYACERGFCVCENQSEENDISQTIRLGMTALPKGIDGCMFSVCDQPFFTKESCEKLAAAFAVNPDKIVAAACDGTRKNPVIFPEKYFRELSELKENHSGSSVIAKHPDDLLLIQISNKELKDIDTTSDLNPDRS